MRGKGGEYKGEVARERGRYLYTEYSIHSSDFSVPCQQW